MSDFDLSTPELAEEMDDVTESSSGNHTAPEGQVWICAACGKQSRDPYGYQKISRGWDESCMLNAVLCYEQKEGETKWKVVEEQP